MVRVPQALKTSVLFIVLIAAAPHCPAQSDGADSPNPNGGAFATVKLTVYKKWIGASGDEGSVEIHLSCGPKDAFEPRRIDRNQPDGWEVRDVPPDGLTCSVREIERETFIADVEDCHDLLVLPGEEAECTIVNTKVVKRIDMLNRYGLIMMIAVMLGAGLAGVKSLGGRT